VTELFEDNRPNRQDNVNQDEGPEILKFEEKQDVLMRYIH